MRKLHWKPALTGAAAVLATVVALPASAQTLPQAIKHALKTNPDVQFQVARRFAVGEELNQKKAFLLPKIDLTAGYGRERSLNPTALTVSGATGLTLSRREAQAAITQTLFAGGGNISEVHRMRAHMHAEVHDLVRISEDVGLQTAEAYVDIMRYQHMLRLARMNVAEHERVYEMIRERSESGLTRKADLNQAEGRLALARANLVAEQSHLRDATAFFIKVVGQKPRNLTWPKSPSRKVLKNNLKQSTRFAQKHNPAVKAITADVAANEAELRTAKSFLFPKN